MEGPRSAHRVEALASAHWDGRLVDAHGQGQTREEDSRNVSPAKQPQSLVASAYVGVRRHRRLSSARGGEWLRPVSESVIPALWRTADGVVNALTSMHAPRRRSPEPLCPHGWTGFDSHDDSPGVDSLRRLRAALTRSLPWRLYSRVHAVGNRTDRRRATTVRPATPQSPLCCCRVHPVHTVSMRRTVQGGRRATGIPSADRAR